MLDSGILSGALNYMVRIVGILSHDSANIMGNFVTRIEYFGLQTWKKLQVVQATLADILSEITLF